MGGYLAVTQPTQNKQFKRQKNNTLPGLKTTSIRLTIQLNKVCC